MVSRSQRSQRLFDLVIALPAMVILSPLFLLLAIWIKLDSKGPVLFLQRRIGRFGHPFDIIKFRTMIVDSEKWGPQLTIGRDPRITRSGHFLRKYRLDELPQLINVIRGEMSLVGPRPEVPRYVDLYTEQQRMILAFRPGMTSPATVAFNNESELLAQHPDPEFFYRAELIPEKIRQDLTYAQQATLWSDCAVLLQTFLRLFR